MVQFSSGTTGEPKPVALTHAQVLANASAILDIEPDDEGFSPSGVTWLPLYHDMGLIGCIFPALLTPASLTLIPPEAFLAKPAICPRAEPVPWTHLSRTQLRLRPVYRAHRR